MTPPPDQPVSEATVEQLEPCPFCGERCANLVIDQGDKWAHYEPSCLEVRTGYDLSAAAPWRADAIAAWNQRTRPPVVDGLSAELERLDRPEACIGKSQYIPISRETLRRILTALSRPAPETTASDDVVEAMAQRFLNWPLPDNFSPDAGISFEPEFNVEWNAAQGLPPQRHNPTGTNLFDLEQAKAMVRHMTANPPKPTEQDAGGGA